MPVRTCWTLPYRRRAPGPEWPRAARLLHAERRVRGQVAALHDDPEDADVVRVGGHDVDDVALAPGLAVGALGVVARVDVDDQGGGVELARRAAGLGLCRE